MTLSEIEQIRARHHNAGPNLEGEHYCEDCWGRDAYWPCDASLLLAALSEAEAENARQDKALTVAIGRLRATTDAYDRETLSQVCAALAQEHKEERDG